MYDYLFRICNRAKCILFKITHPYLWNTTVRLHGVPRIECADNIVFGKNVSINQSVYIQGQGNVFIGDDVVLSFGVTILTRELDFDSIKKGGKNRKHVNNAVIIGHNTWIASNATILPGVVIPSNCIIAAGAVVANSLTDENALYGGNPARFIKFLE